MTFSSSRSRLTCLALLFTTTLLFLATLWQQTQANAVADNLTHYSHPGFSYHVFLSEPDPEDAGNGVAEESEALPSRLPGKAELVSTPGHPSL